MFLRNAWYVAAWANEVRDNLLARRIVDQPILLYRLADGAPVALFDRCPHRFAPLSRGCKVGDHIRCGYHGLTFEASGRCVANPLGKGDIPEAAVVRVLPAVERHGLVWVWAGDPDRADSTQIPDLSVVARPEAGNFGEGYLHVRANYQLAIDNLMDLSHAAILHEETLGQTTLNLQDGELRVSRRGGWIKASVEMRNVEFEAGAQVDQWLETEWAAPGVIVLTLAQAKPGKPWQNDPVRALHIVTPETALTSHYFFGSIHLDGRKAFVRDPFVDEDEPMLAGCQDRMGEQDFWSLRPVILRNDAAAIQVRLQLEKMIRSERPT